MPELHLVGLLYIIVCFECCVLSGRGLRDELITRPEEHYRLWRVVVCDLETSWMRRPWPTGGLLRQNQNKKNNKEIFYDQKSQSVCPKSLFKFYLGFVIPVISSFPLTPRKTRHTSWTTCANYPHLFIIRSAIAQTQRLYKTRRVTQRIRLLQTTACPEGEMWQETLRYLGTNLNSTVTSLFAKFLLCFCFIKYEQIYCSCSPILCSRDNRLDPRRQIGFQVRHPRCIVYNYKYKQYIVKHNSINDFT